MESDSTKGGETTGSMLTTPNIRRIIWLRTRT